MPKYADYIKRIEIDSLWSGKKHIIWELNRQVNILSGSNGQGKSTILNKVVKGLSAGGEFPSHMLKGVKLDVVPEDAKWIRYDVIRSLDSPMVELTESGLMNSLAKIREIAGPRQPYHCSVAAGKHGCSPAPVGTEETLPGYR